MSTSGRLQMVQSSEAMRRLIGNSPAFSTEGYSPDAKEWDFVNVLVIGAGGIGCELLHLLALSGFAELTIIDMDTIELSNLNRQFLFREEDIGKPKSEVAAARVGERCSGVSINAIFGRIEDQSDSFYRNFDVIALGLDSVGARRWINSKVAELARWEARAATAEELAEGSGPMISCITDAIPLIDTGTEGFMGHCRVINMVNNTTPCIECEMYLFDGAPKQVPMCTLENIPRSPEHCVLFVQFKTWVDERGGEVLDGDDFEHVRWVTERARARQEAFRIGGPPIDDLFAVGVIKNVVPAVGFTNSLVAGLAVTEVLKSLTGVAPVLDNYTLWDGRAEIGANFSTQRLFGSPSNSNESVCGVCGPRPVVSLRCDMTPAEVSAAIIKATATPSEQADEALADTTTSLLLQSDGGGGELYLRYRTGDPFAIAVTGATMSDIFISAGHQAFLRSWCAGSPPAVWGLCIGGGGKVFSALCTCNQ